MFNITYPSVEYSDVGIYLFYYILVFLRRLYLFIINLPWADIIFWASLIAIILIFLFIVGITYNVIKIIRLKQK